MSWGTHGWQQQVAKFHSSRPTQMPLPVLPAALFSLKTPVAALALRMISRVSLTLLPLSVKRSPKVVLALVMTPPICFALVIFAGLEAAPNTGRWRFLFTNEEEELSMLKDELPVFMESIKVIKDEDDARVRLVKHILQNLLSSSIEQDGSTLRTGIVEKLEKKYEEAQLKLKELQQQMAANEVVNDDSTLQATGATSKRIVSTQMPVPSTAPNSGGAVADEEEEEEDPDLKSISFEDRPFQIFVAEDDAVNAFSLGPPRLIYINSGLLEWLDNDEDLVAAVVAHELAHVIQRHTMETHGRETVMLFLADLLRSALWTVSIPLGPWFNSWVDKTTNNLLHFTASGPLHQAIEVEADTVSLTLLALAGYDPMHAVRLWEMWAEKDLKVMVEEDSVELHQWTDWMYDHPPSAERAKYLKEAVMPAREMWEKVLKRRKDPMKRFLSLETRLRAHVDEDGDLTDATVQDVMETMDELLKKQEEEEAASGVFGTLRRWAKWRPWASSDIEATVVNA
ncbi:MAG: peptidase family M48-domain-containing protein [Benniella sp.]|nr:MAG: peptidase family M48-domain-containing protein [Benniella sp.]